MTPLTTVTLLRKIDVKIESLISTTCIALGGIYVYTVYKNINLRKNFNLNFMHVFNVVSFNVCISIINNM